MVICRHVDGFLLVTIIIRDAPDIWCYWWWHRYRGVFGKGARIPAILGTVSYKKELPCDLLNFKNQI